jgi:hypothetical protein
MRGVLKMKSIAKMLLVGAVAMTAYGFASVPSQAAKKAEPVPCVPGLVCTAKCKGTACNVNACNYQGKWTAAYWTPTCTQPYCPPAKC